MSNVARCHVRYLLPDSGAKRHAGRTSTAQPSGAHVPPGHGRYLLPAVSRGDS